MARKISRVLVLLVFLLLPLYYVRFKFGPIPTNLIEVLIILAFLTSLAGDVKAPAIPRQLIIAAALLVIGIAVSALNAPDKVAALGILKGWFIMPILFGWTYWRLDDSSLRRFSCAALTVNLLLVALYAVLQRYGVIGLTGYQRNSTEFAQYIEQGRAFAIFESPNYLAMYLAPIGLLVAHFWNKQGNRLLSGSTLAVTLLAIFFSQSRAGILALVAGLIALFLWDKYRKAALWLFVALTIVSFTYFGFSPKAGTGDETRVYIWKQSIQLIREHPLVGIGSGQLQQVLDQRVGDQPAYQQFVHAFALHSHNLFLTMWLSGGILALIGLIYLLWFLISSAYRSSSEYVAGAMAALFAVLAHGMFDTTYFKNDLAIIFWFVAVLLLIPSVGQNSYDEPNK